MLTPAEYMKFMADYAAQVLASLPPVPTTVTTPNNE
ncbi:hypothetical protein [Lundtoftevirus Lu221]|uniref:Uncharacterized protein n=1 Tax=phage PKM.Lu.22.1 TaxID=3049197 RepID=A0AAF0RDE4_9CAUD|nr:hypothetical protein [phage PKM.Lu.22.1]